MSWAKSTNISLHRGFDDKCVSSLNVAEIENDIFKAESKNDLLSACASFLNMKLQQKRGMKLDRGDATSLRRSEVFEPSIRELKLPPANWSQSSTVLNFANSCIELKNVDMYSKQFNHEISRSVSVLSIEEILPMPGDCLKKPKFRTVINKNERKHRNNTPTFCTRLLTLIAKMLFLKKLQHNSQNRKRMIPLMTTISTQTEGRPKKTVQKKRYSNLIKEHRSSTMGHPEEILEYQNWKEKYNQEMKGKRIQFQKNRTSCPIDLRDSCLTVVETKVKTKKFTRMSNQSSRKASSKLSLIDDGELSDEFDSYWRDRKSVV